jgi:hypothetical protein
MVAMKKKATDKTLKAVITFLQMKAADGAMEPGQAKAITKSIGKLRQAFRTGDPRKISSAVDLVAKAFLLGVR